MATIAGTMDCLGKLAGIKREEENSEDKKLHRVKHFICMDKTEVSEFDK